jgi:hypothetical protein
MRHEPQSIFPVSLLGFTLFFSFMHPKQYVILSSASWHDVAEDAEQDGDSDEQRDEADYHGCRWVNVSHERYDELFDDWVELTVDDEHDEHTDQGYHRELGFESSFF